MKNDTTFVCMRSRGHRGDTNKVEKAPHFVEFNFLLNRNIKQRVP